MHREHSFQLTFSSFYSKLEYKIIKGENGIMVSNLFDIV